MFEFDEVLFRETFSEFSSETDYPIAVLQSVFNSTSSIITNAKFLSDLLLLTAHILKVRKNENGGQAEHVVSSSANGESITILSPNFKNNFERFLYATAYGKELSITLSMRAYSDRIYIR